MYRQTYLRDHRLTLCLIEDENEGTAGDFIFLVVYFVQPNNVLVKRTEGIKPDIRMADISVCIYEPFTFGVKI